MSSVKKKNGRLIPTAVTVGIAGTAMIFLLLLIYAVLIGNGKTTGEQSRAVFMGIFFVSGFISQVLSHDVSREGALTKAAVASVAVLLIFSIFSVLTHSGRIITGKALLYVILFGVGSAAGSMARIDKKHKRK